MHITGVTIDNFSDVHYEQRCHLHRENSQSNWKKFHTFKIYSMKWRSRKDKRSICGTHNVIANVRTIFQIWLTFNLLNVWWYTDKRPCMCMKRSLAWVYVLTSSKWFHFELKFHTFRWRIVQHNVGICTTGRYQSVIIVKIYLRLLLKSALRFIIASRENWIEE